MTMSNIRRSSRIVSRESHRYKESSDSEDSEHDVEGSDSDYDYAEPSRKRTKTVSKVATKRRNTISNRQSVPTEEEGNFVENKLFKALSDPNAATETLAVDWLNTYSEKELSVENGTGESMSDLINLLLRSCGCKYQVEAHDVINLESAAETVGEITVAFKLQRTHEYPFFAANKSLKFFRRNVTDFFVSLISVAHENGLLYSSEVVNISTGGDESELPGDSLVSSLMNSVLIWFSCLSSCTVRSLRFTATEILLNIQSELCSLNLNITNSLEKNQRHLTRSKSSSKLRSRAGTHSEKNEAISTNIRRYQLQKDTILEYLSSIIETTFIHRYRDIDPHIRQICLKALCNWMLLYSDFFFQSSYLRYFGWMLSDPSNIVRAEVAKSLFKLYKSVEHGNQSLGFGFRQFTERFKTQLINMSRDDVDYNVKSNLIGTCIILARINFLAEEDEKELALVLLEITTDKLNDSPDDKLKAELARFVNVAITEKANEYSEKFSLLLADYTSPQFGNEQGKLAPTECWKCKALMDLLKAAKKKFLERPKAFPERKQKSLNPISAAYEALYAQNTYDDSLGFLIRYFLLDSSLIEFVPVKKVHNVGSKLLKELKESLTISEDDSYYLVAFICGSVSYLFGQKKIKAEGSKLEETRAQLLLMLVDHIPSLLNYLLKSEECFFMFLEMWNILLSVSSDKDNIISTFQNMGQISTYNDINSKILKFYINYDYLIRSYDLFSVVYDAYFTNLLANYEGFRLHDMGIEVSDIPHLLNSEIKLLIQNSIEKIIAEVKGLLDDFFKHNSSSLELEEINTQLSIIQLIIDLRLPVLKLSKLGEYVDINIVIERKESGIMKLISRLLLNLKINVLVENLSQKFLDFFTELFSSYEFILGLILILSSWKSEELIRVSFVDTSVTELQYDLQKAFRPIKDLIFIQMQKLESFSDSKKYISSHSMSSLSSISHQDELNLASQLDDVVSLSATKLIDLIVPLKVLFIRLKHKTNFRKYYDYFIQPDFLGNLVTQPIPSKVQQILLDVFLLKEATLASLLGIELERSDREDVSFNSLHDDTENVSVNDEGTGIELNDTDRIKRTMANLKKSQEQEAKIWFAEKSLCTFAIKLFSLIRASMVDAFINERLRLNASKIGGVYLKIVYQHEEQSISRSESDDSRVDTLTDKANSSSTALTNPSGGDSEL